MNPPPQLFTAAQIARALGVTDRAVKLRLAGVAAPGTVTVRGQRANAWPFKSLPASLLSELSALADRGGCASIDHLLADPRERWQPPFAWHQIAVPFRDQAEKLSAALAPALARQHELDGPALLEFAGIRYRQQLGNDLAPDKLRYLLDRATKRDNGFQQWERPELFLDDAAFHQTTVPLQVKQLHQPLDEHVAQMTSQTKPTLEDRAFLFHETFRHFEKLIAGRPSRGEQRTIKLSLVEYLLHNAPGLYRPQAAAGHAGANKPLLALRALFNHCFVEWVAGGRVIEALMDRRAGSSGRKGYQCAGCEKKILAAAARFRGAKGKTGNVDLAVKNLVERSELCRNCLELLTHNRMPSAMRQRVTPNALQVAHLKGPEFVRAIGPTHHNDWSDTAPGDRFVIDDMTTNELAWHEADGKIVSGQVQLLYTEDEFSSMPLPFLMYFGAPNSRTIKKTLWTVFANIGLPHISLYIERGVFANRTLIGERRAKEALQFRELEAGLKNLFEVAPIGEDELARLRGLELGLRDPALGLKIEHAHSPQAKTVERGFYELQKRSSILPGFGGFNQRFEKSRAMRDFDRRVSDGNEHPGNEYLHLSELRKNYEQICGETMHRPVNGVRHRGRSPLDVWTEALLRRPLRRLPTEIESLFALRQVPLTVRPDGICVPLDKFEDAFYFNALTGPLIGRKVSVRVNYDLPEFIFVEHPDTRKLFKVERVLTRRRTASLTELSKSAAARRAHINGALGEIGNVASPVASWVIRSNDYTPEDKERGHFITAATEEHKAEQARAQKEIQHLKRRAGALGSALPSKPLNLKRASEALDLEQEARAEIAAMKGVEGHE